MPQLISNNYTSLLHYKLLFCTFLLLVLILCGFVFLLLFLFVSITSFLCIAYFVALDYSFLSIL